MTRCFSSEKPSKQTWASPLIVAIATLILSHQIDAAEFEARLAWQKWNQHYEGFVDSKDLNNTVALGSVDLSNDLGFDKENADAFYLVLEHPIGVVPNVRLQYTELETETRSTLSRDISYEDVVFNANQAIYSDLDLSHNDISFYWQPIQGSLSVGLGFTVRMVDGSFLIATDDGSRFVRQTIADTIPLPYFQMQYQFANKKLTLGAELHGAAYSGDRFIDTNIRAAYETDSGVGLEAGYRVVQLRADELDIEDENNADDFIDIDIELKGLYFGIFYSF